MQPFALYALLGQVIRQIFGQPLGQGRDQHAARRPRPAREFARADAALAPRRGLISITGSNKPVGRMTCSTTSPPDCCNSYGPGVAETYTTSRIRRSNSSSAAAGYQALGKRKPCSTSVDLRL